MIGAFYQPRAVIADTDTLNTLDDRQLSAGLAEIIKYGLIRDADFLDWLEQNMGKLVARDTGCLIEAIERSCQHKAEVVAADELESGQRALLNLGHTYGHAIETGMGYGQWLHGEAVAAGMCMAARHSQKLGWISAQDVARVVDLCASANLPTDKPETLSGEEMLDHMQVDKKVVDGTIRLVLFRAIGDAIVTGDYPHETLLSTLGMN
jgi:3-dehydroquinate synthase